MAIATEDARKTLQGSTSKPSNHRGLWITLALVIGASFSILGLVGIQISKEKPPIPDLVVSDGQVLFTGDDIRQGQQVWQSLGGQEIGSIWGHGAYLAPDWSADWLHREAIAVRDLLAAQRGAGDFDVLDLERQAAIEARVQAVFRTNTWNESTGTLELDPLRAQVYDSIAAHFIGVFANGVDDYAIPEGTLTDIERGQDMATFFWWTSWAASTERIGSSESYTQNWPHEPLVGNTPTPGNIFWTGVSVILLLAGIGAMVWYFAARREEELDPEEAPADDPLLGSSPTPSQRATLKYFYVVGAMLALQILTGIVVAHYGVEGDFYGIPLSKILPYSVARTWHLQLGILWIATAWLATGLFVGPAVSQTEPRFQRAGVNILFGALLVVVAGSMVGEWLSAQQLLGDGSAWFWIGHQGYEYLDLGRLWQFGLFIGLVLWMVLMVRALLPALRHGPVEQRSLLGLLLLATGAITGFYAAAFGIGQSTHLTTAEYWRWWVVHLWVEGFFEVFATVVIAFLFARLGLVRMAMATRAALFSTVIFLSGGILGTFHHLYFSGTPKTVIALGASFSALECVPLVLIGFEAVRNLRMAKMRTWVATYRWAIYFFVAVGFWNLVGAGIFGFVLNPPIALYYMQGLNTTPVHAHTALFGVYGMLGIGLMLFCVRALTPGRQWRDGSIKLGFWAMNIGLGAMVLFSVLPIGLAQTWVAVEKGTWYARSSEFLNGNDALEVLRWMRIPGDTLFAVGALAIGWFMVGILTGRSIDNTGPSVIAGSPVAAEPEPIPELVGASHE